LDADGDEYGFVPLLLETIEALATAPLKEFTPVEFLLDGARLKLSFRQEECESCGASSAHFHTAPMDQYAEELRGLWVALVPAENDRHLKMKIPTPTFGDKDMTCHTKEQLEEMLFDVVNELDLSDLMIEEHGPLGTPPATLVRLVLERKDLEIRMLKQGFVAVTPNASVSGAEPQAERPTRRNS